MSYLRNQRSQTPLGVQDVADDLQKKYREYDRRKKNAFKKMIERACTIVRDEDGMSDKVQLANQKSKKRKTEQLDEGSGSDSFSSESEDYVEYKDCNAMNSTVATMYRKAQKKTAMCAASSRTSPGPASPRRAETGTQEPSLGRSLFVIDKTGDKELGQSSKKKSKNKAAKGGDSDALRRHGDEIGREGRSSFAENTETLRSTRGDDVSYSAVSSPMSVDATGADTMIAGETTDALSVKSEKKAKNVKKKSEKRKKKLPEIERSTVTFANVGGNEKTIEEVCKLLVHMKHPEVYRQLGVQPPRGFLLHGPPGCGKTLLAHAIAGELALPFIKLAATEIVSGVSGESEEKVRDIFDQAVSASPCILFIDEIDAITQKRENASKDMERRIVAQLLTCMDDLNAKPDVQVIVIGATNREDSLDPALRRAGRFDREICMGIPDEKARMGILQVLCKDLRLSPGFDYLQLARSTPGFVGADLMALAREAAMTAVNRVFTECQTTKQNVMESVAGQTVALSGEEETEGRGIPIASKPCQSSTAGRDTPQAACVSAMDVEHHDVGGGEGRTASRSGGEHLINPGSVGDVNGLETTETSAGDVSRRRMEARAPLSSSVLSVLDWLKDEPPLTPEHMAGLYITAEDFAHACQVVQPSAKREGFATIPDVTWDDVGALYNVREELELAILAPVRHPDEFQALGITTPAGVLLAGPPGCGKTLLAKAVANESGLNFISVKGPELLNMYVGESERAVRQVFTRARNSAPCVIFFDELDALCPKRTGSSEGGSSARVVNQLLTEMDGLEERKQVFIMGATNRPDILDPAVLRPGRLDKVIYVGLPNQQDRADILRTLTKNGTKPKLTDSVNLNDIAQQAKCQCYTGADLAALVREASVLALKDFMKEHRGDKSRAVCVSRSHFDLALDKIKPSVSAKDQEKYERMKQQFTVT